MCPVYSALKIDHKKLAQSRGYKVNAYFLPAICYFEPTAFMQLEVQKGIDLKFCCEICLS